MFTKPLSKEALYWIGYLHADGCMVSKIGQEYKPGKTRKRGGYVCFGQVYKYPVEKFKEFINGNGNIRVIHSDKGFKPYTFYQISSSVPYYQLLDINLKKQLSNDIYNSIDFWRGLLEGDGSLGIYKNHMNKYPAIYWSGTEYDMVKCSDWIESLNYKRPKVGKARSIFRVGLNGKPAANLIKLLYYENCYSVLEYKYQKAQEIISLLS